MSELLKVSDVHEGTFRCSVVWGMGSCFICLSSDWLALASGGPVTVHFEGGGLAPLYIGIWCQPVTMAAKTGATYTTGKGSCSEWILPDPQITLVL